MSPSLESPSPALPAIPVAAALVFQHGRLLITRRPPGSHLAGLWEFPGGKLEPGEGWEAAVRREVREELDIDVDVLRLFSEITHRYPGKTVHLRFFVCALQSGTPQTIGCSEFKWVSREELTDHEFPPADREILGQLLVLKEFGEKAPKSL